VGGLGSVQVERQRLIRLYEGWPDLIQAIRTEAAAVVTATRSADKDGVHQ